MKKLYKDNQCCGMPSKASPLQLVPTGKFKGTNTCAGKHTQAIKDTYKNIDCFKQQVANVLEQAGADVSVGYTGQRDTQAEPIKTTLFKGNLCPVNVHWHLGAE